MIPWFDGVILSLEWKEAVWGTTRHAVRSSNTAVASFALDAGPDLGIKPKTVAKWRKRTTVEDLKAPNSTTLTQAEEAMVVAFRRHTLLPLDDCLYALEPSIPHLTRSALHRCLQRHGISRLPDIAGDKALLSEVEEPKRQHFKRYPTGFFHIDIAEVQGEAGGRRRVDGQGGLPHPRRRGTPPADRTPRWPPPR